MQIAIACPHCGRQYAVDRAHVGRSVPCQQCQQTFVIEEPQVEPGLVPLEPSPGLVPIESPAAAPAGMSPAPTSPAGVPKKKKKKKRKAGLGNVYQDARGYWRAKVTLEQVLACPGTWMIAIAALYLLVWLTGLTEGIEPIGALLMLALSVVGGLVHWHYYYHVWSDLYERRGSEEDSKAPHPLWANAGYVVAGLLLLAVMVGFEAMTEERTLQEAYKRYASRGSEAEVRAAVDFCHSRNYKRHVITHVRRGSTFDKVGYFRDMDADINEYFERNRRLLGH